MDPNKLKNLKDGVSSILNGADSNPYKVIEQNITKPGVKFSETKAFKVLLVLGFFLFIYKIIKKILLFFDITNEIIISMYVSWMLILLIFWAFLPQDLSYLKRGAV